VYLPHDYRSDLRAARVADRVAEVADPSATDLSVT
jgi:hypothetical protein